MAGVPPEKRKDLERLLREERSRGTKTRLPDEEAVQERQLLVEDMRQLLRIGDKKAFLRMLTENYGLQVGSERYNAALQVWNEHQRGRKPSR